MRDRRDVRMQVLLTARQRQMLEKLAQIQRRSMNDVVRLAIERVYQTETLRIADAAGRARASGSAAGKSS